MTMRPKRRSVSRLLACAAFAICAGMYVAFGVAARNANGENCVVDRFGAVVRMDTLQPDVYLIFSADSMFEGAPHALDVMAERNIKASFFFTGNFLRDSRNNDIVERVRREGHYIGPHSDGHILLAAWDGKRTSLVTPDSLIDDLRRNYAELRRHGISPDSATVVLPPFEWCASEHTDAYRRNGYLPINPSPEITTYRDYTTPDMPEYRSSERMLDELYQTEKQRGLNGAIIILHLGTQDVRTDKLYHHLDAIVDTLTARGYRFARF